MSNAAPFHELLADGPEGGFAVWTRAADGVRLRVAMWPKRDARGTICLFPGRTEYVEKYGRAAKAFHARGYGVIAIDWRGQGLSDRLIEDPMTGHVFDFSDYQSDVKALLDVAEVNELPKPWYLVAHSMGGCIGLRSVMDGMSVNAVAFSSPMWGIRMSAPLRPIAWAVAWAAPKMGRGEEYAPGTSAQSYADNQPFEGNVLTNDPEMFAYMQAQTRSDPNLALGGPSLHWLYQALSETRKLRTSPAPALPAMAQIGTHEKIVDIRPVEEIMAKWKGGSLTLIEGAEHELMMERPAVREGFFDAASSLFARSV